MDFGNRPDKASQQHGATARPELAETRTVGPSGPVFRCCMRFGAPIVLGSGTHVTRAPAMWGHAPLRHAGHGRCLRVPVPRTMGARGRRRTAARTHPVRATRHGGGTDDVRPCRVVAWTPRHLATDARCPSCQRATRYLHLVTRHCQPASVLSPCTCQPCPTPSQTAGCRENGRAAPLRRCLSSVLTLPTCQCLPALSEVSSHYLGRPQESPHEAG